jgi:pimeloyl-ACP methyl ester carboxylesterase
MGVDYNEHRREGGEHRVKEAIPGRELFSLDVFGVAVQGTCHLSQKDSSATETALSDQRGTGIVLLSGLLSPRAATGDSAVYWAQSFAEGGYKSFRVDLPGTCDSGGDAPAELMNFINCGNYEAVTVEIIRQIILRYNLSDVILLGHCSGSVTALFAAAACKNCRGLILLEPYFHLPPTVADRTRTRLALSQWAASNRLGGLLSNLFDCLKDLKLRLRSNELPGNANYSLLNRWNSVASVGLPILLLKAPGLKASGGNARLGEFDYISYAVRRGGNLSRVEVQVIEGAGHSFADRVGRVAVRQYAESWLRKFFPLTSAETPLALDQGSQDMELGATSEGVAVPAYVLPENVGMSHVGNEVTISSA